MAINLLTQYVILVTVLIGCSEPSESDIIGPRTAKFRRGATFAVCTTTEAANDLTIDRQDPASGEMLHLTQPPLVTKSDLKDATIMEAPGQWPIVYVTFDQPTAERLSGDVIAGGGNIAVVINDKVLFATPCRDPLIDKIALRSIIGGPDIRDCFE